MGRNRFWPMFWSVAGAVSVRTKIMGIITGLILALGFVVSVVVQRGLSATLERELEERGLAITTSLSSQAQELILTDHLFALYTLAKDTLDTYKDILYVFFVDRDGNILVHTFEGGFPEDLRQIHRKKGWDGVRVEVFDTEQGPVRNIAVPILNARAGVVHVGMLERGMAETVAGYVRQVILATAAVLLVGLLFAFILSTILTKPVSQLVQATEAIGRGDFTWKAPPWAKDEIGRLGTAFEAMAEELKRKEGLRAQLLQKVISAQEEERKRIARELHDETSQSLTSLMVGLKVLEETRNPEEVPLRAAELRSLVAKTLDEVHHLAHALRPSILDDLGLVAALERYAKGYEGTTGLHVDFYAQDLDGRRLPPPVETTLYRIVQEALTNVAKHANAQNVSIVLEQRGPGVVAVVEDDGRGFDVAWWRSREGAKGLGLAGIEERASLFGGTLTVESRPGSGTTIAVEIPLEMPEVR